MARLSVALEWFTNPDHVPLLVARQLGWLEEEGLELELVEPKEHFDAFAAMQAGEVDVAITEPIHLVQDIAKGEPMVGFARFLHTNGGVMYLERSGITRPRDMAGKRVQYPGAPGPGGTAIVRTMIEADGGEAGELQPVNNGFFHTDALAEDKADVATLAFYNFEVVEATHRDLKPGFFALKDWGVPDFCQLILVALPETVEQRRDDLQALLRVIRRGIDLVKQDPARAEALYHEATGTSSDGGLGDAIFAATVPCFTHDLSMSTEYWVNLDMWLVQTGQIEESTGDPRSYWTNGLALPR